MKIGERWKSESVERALKLDENAGTEQITIYYIQGFFVYNKGQLKLKPNYKRIISHLLVLQCYSCLNVSCTQCILHTPNKYNNTCILLIKSFLCLILDFGYMQCNGTSVRAKFWTKRNVVFRFGWKPTKIQTQIIIHEAYNDIGPRRSTTLHSFASFLFLTALSDKCRYFSLCRCRQQRYRVGMNEHKAVSRYTRCRILYY